MNLKEKNNKIFTQLPPEWGQYEMQLSDRIKYMQEFKTDSEEVQDEDYHIRVYELWWTHKG